MAVVIDSGPIEATDKLDDVPRKQWRSLMIARRGFMEVRLSYDCRCLVQFVDDARRMYSELGFASVEQMVREGYGLEPDEIQVAVEWLRLNPPDDPISLDGVKTLARHGGNRGQEHDASGKFIKGTGKPQVDNSNLRLGGGTSRDYTISRLERADPKDLALKGMTAKQFADLAAKVKAEEISATAAAIEAGIRKKLSPLEQAIKLLPKLTAAECAKLKRVLDQYKRSGVQ